MKFAQMMQGAMSSADVGPMCFIEFGAAAAFYQDILEHFTSVVRLHENADLFSSKTLPQPTLPNVKLPA